MSDKNWAGKAASLPAKEVQRHSLSRMLNCVRSAPGVSVLRSRPWTIDLLQSIDLLQGMSLARKMKMWVLRQDLVGQRIARRWNRDGKGIPRRASE